jgi:hypothetical protein
MTLFINNEDEFNSSIKRIYDIIVTSQGNLPGLDTPQGKELQMLMSMAFAYEQKTNPSNPDPMETIMERIRQLGYTGS